MRRNSPFSASKKSFKQSSLHTSCEKQYDSTAVRHFNLNHTPLFHRAAHHISVLYLESCAIFSLAVAQGGKDEAIILQRNDQGDDKRQDEKTVSSRKSPSHHKDATSWIPPRKVNKKAEDGETCAQAPLTATATNNNSSLPRIKVDAVGRAVVVSLTTQSPKKVVQSILDEVAKQHTDTELVLCSGRGHVPMMAFSWASRNNVQAVQVVSAAVRSRAKGVSDRITIGRYHGDESDHFVGMVGVLVRIGVGPQSRAEVKQFRQQKPGNLVVEQELPLL